MSRTVGPYDPTKASADLLIGARGLSDGNGQPPAAQFTRVAARAGGAAGRAEVGLAKFARTASPTLAISASE